MKIKHHLFEVLHIKADNIRNKSSPPIFGSTKGVMNDTVVSHRKLLKEFIDFKYGELVLTEG